MLNNADTVTLKSTQKHYVPSKRFTTLNATQKQDS